MTKYFLWWLYTKYEVDTDTKYKENDIEDENDMMK